MNSRTQVSLYVADSVFTLERVNGTRRVTKSEKELGRREISVPHTDKSLGLHIVSVSRHIVVRGQGDFRLDWDGYEGVIVQVC